MTDDSIRPGQVWVERGKEEYGPGETPKKQRLWLVVGKLERNPRSPVGGLQVAMMHLESGNVKRVNASVIRARSKRSGRVRWELWLEPGTVPDLNDGTEPSGK